MPNTLFTCFWAIACSVYTISQGYNACLEVWVISGKSLSYCPVPLQWSVKLMFSLKTSALALKSPSQSSCFLSEHFTVPRFHAEAAAVSKVMRTKMSSVHSSPRSSCDWQRPLRRAAKLDVNKATAFIKSDPYELHSQECEEQANWRISLSAHWRAPEAPK